MEALDRRFAGLRLLPNHRDLIRKIGKPNSPRGVETRHEALLRLLPFVEKLDLPPAGGEKRSVVRIGLPAELDEALDRRSTETGFAKLDLLLLAAHQYRKKWPLEEE